MTAVIAWLTFLAVAVTPTYEREVIDAVVGYYESIVDQGHGVVGYPGELRIVDGEFAEGFLPVALCESGYNQGAVSPMGCLGLMQLCRDTAMLKVVTGMGYAWDDMLQADANIHVAERWWTLTGRNWSHWACAYPLGLVY